MLKLIIENKNIKNQLKHSNKKRGKLYAKILEVYKKLNLINIPFSDKIINRAYEIRQYNIKNMDSLHIAYAESFNIDYFITTDKLLVNASNRVNLKLKVINPINFIMEVI